jgi:ABC-2 type transport system ATP-binding protein
MIEVEQLRKSYGELVAVEGVSFTVRPGEVFGLLGPNGAGKTTTIGCISGLLIPDRGQVRVMGYDVRKDGVLARRRLGLVPQEIALYEDLSAQENLAYWGGAYGLAGDLLKARIREALEWIGLEDRARQPVKSFSGGMKRRLNFACGILHRPPVLLLDEPAVGVDPQSRVRLLELVREQARAGVCVVYTTHYMEEAEALCDRVGIMDRGKMAAQGTLLELRAMLGERDLLRLSGSFPLESLRPALAAVEGLEIIQADENLLRLALFDGPRRLPALLGALTAAGAEIRETTLTQPSLESLFIKLTGKELRE